MFGIGWPELLIIALVGFFVFGPERLPEAARDLSRMIRQLRSMAQGVTDDLKQHLPEPSEFGLDDYSDLRQLHPKVMMAGLFADDEPRVAAAGPPAGRNSPPKPMAGVPAGGLPPYDLDAT